MSLPSDDWQSFYGDIDSHDGGIEGCMAEVKEGI